MPPLVRDLTLTQAKELFRYNYWLPMQANTMPAPLSLIVTDAAFNNGTGRATQWLQQAVGAAVDGAIGPLTMGALSRALTASGPEHIAIEIMARRTTFMAALPKWPVFGLGWSRRLSALPYEAMRLAAAGT
jgi:lysozyme family protein